MGYDLVIRGGEVVTPTGVQRCAIGIKGGKIAALSLEPLEGEEVLDASGKLVLPGVIDPHVHLEMPVDGLHTADDFYTGTVAAAFGGVTTLLDFAIQAPGQSELESISARRAAADPKVVIDYSLHANFTEQGPASLTEIPKIIASGITSFKLLTAYRRRGLMVDSGFLYAVLRETRAWGGLVTLHAEDGYINEYLMERLISEGKTGWIYHYESRPNSVEAAAIASAIEIAKGLGAPLYIVHLSTKEGLELIERAKRAGYPIYAETCPHYLEFTKEKYLDEAGPEYIMSPPLRGEADREALWAGLAEGSIDVVASEHCPFTRAEKRSARTFAEVPSGVMGIETMLPYLFSEGVSKGRLGLARLIELIAANPARLFGLEGKGAIALGKDADLVILDPDLERPVRAEELHMNTDYNIYEGKLLRGWPVTTISRGEVIMKDGVFLGSMGRGRFISRRGPRLIGAPHAGGS
ncbi:MAG: dihydropyrimidinase [Candidatus Bipolaricaulia bacterium]